MIGTCGNEETLEERPMTPAPDPHHDDLAAEEESDVSPAEQEKQDKKDYAEHVKEQVGNYL